MEETKIWWQSKTIWASTAQILVGIAVSLGFFTEAQGAQVTAQFPEVMIGLTTAVLGLAGLWGRFVATKTLI